MKRSLPIQTPCPYGESWSDMAEEDGGRRCQRCDEHLVDISLLTWSQAKQLKKLSAKVGGLCASVRRDERGAPIYARTKTRRLVVAAGTVLSVSLAACGEPGTPTAGPAMEGRSPPGSVTPEPPTAVPDDMVRVEDADGDADDEQTQADDLAVSPSEAMDDAGVEEHVEPVATEPSSRRRRTRRANRDRYDDDPLVGLAF